MIKHNNQVHVVNEAQFNCNECDFQGTSKTQIDKHIKLKHEVNNQNKGGMIKCRNCGEQFSQKWDLMNHRKLQHKETVAHCKNNQVGKCQFTAESCWWSHDTPLGGNTESIIQCYICKSTFDNKSKMMIHRKNMHKDLVRSCNSYLQNNCKFQNNSCWFLHDLEAMDVDDLENKRKVNSETEQQSGFQKASGKLKPPLRKQKVE